MTGVFAAAVAGVLTVISLSPRSLGWVAWIALVPLFAGLGGASRRATVASAIAYTVVFALVGLEPWFARSTSAYFDLSLRRSVAFTAPPLALLAVVHGTLLGVLFLARPRRAGPFDVVWCAALWTCWEFVRTLLLPYYPAAFVGLSQHATIPALQLASVTGAAGISFVIVAFNVGVAAILSPARSGRRALAALTGIVLAGATVGWGALRVRAVPLAEASGPRVVAVDIEAARGSQSTLASYLAASRAAATRAPALIVWPESALASDVEHDRDTWAKLSGFVDATGVPLLAGGPASARRERSGVAHYNAAHLVVPGAGMRSYYKRGLVPFAETWPAFATRFLGEPPPDLVSLDAGHEPTVFALGDVPFGVLICFEVTSADAARTLAAAGARFLVNLTPDAWFADAGRPPHLPWAAVRAVETGLPLLRAANAGPSVLYDRFGRALARATHAGGPELLAARIPDAAPTIYARMGDVFLAACLALILAGIVPALFSAPAGTRSRTHPAPTH